MCWPLTASRTTASPSASAPQETSRDVLDGGDGQRHALLRVLEHEAARAHGAAVLAPGHEGHVEPPLEQTAPHGAADGTGTHDDEAHALHFAMRRPDGPRPGAGGSYVAMVRPPSTTTTWPVT